MKEICYSVILENDQILLINKPSGCHSTGEDSLESILLADNLLNREIENYGLLQRLDLETSGCFLIAKTNHSYQALQTIIKQHRWQKEYLAIVEGVPTSKLEQKAYLGSRYRGSKKVSISETEKKRFLYAELTAEVETKINQQFSILRIKTAYGRRHQVRAQLASLGYPLLGDELYGAKLNTSELGEHLPKFILHAVKISFPDAKPDYLPDSIECPIPDYLY